jgi:molecular chaperone DnaJ
MKDYYSILGVPRGANQEEIRRAYRMKARQYHPDVNKQDKEAEEKFKEITEAYEVLGDESRRRRYDLFGDGEGRPSIFESGFDGFTSPFGDIFNIFFGRGPTRTTRAAHHGNDLIAIVEIDLEDAYHGVRRELKIPRHERCGDCGGSGLEAGYGLDLCPDCGGEGRITHIRRSAFGAFSSSTSCRRCSGTGEINTHPCQVCGGTGAVRIEDAIEVEIPPGVESGDRIRITGKGEAGEGGGPPGDLYVEINVREHEVFTRRGKDLHAFVSVDMAEAALGKRIEVPTLNGKEELIIPPGSQAGEVFRLRGKGMTSVNSRQRGDLFLTLDLRTPRKLTPEQKRLLEEFQRIESQKGGAQKIFQRLRKAMRS